MELGRLGSGVICRVKAVCHLLRPQQFWTLANVLWASSTAGAPCYGSFNHDSILFFLGAFAKLRKTTRIFVLSVRPFVCPRGTNSAPTGQIFMKFDAWMFYGNMSRNANVHWNLIRINGALREGQYTFLSYVSQLFLKWEIFRTEF